MVFVVSDDEIRDPFPDGVVEIVVEQFLDSGSVGVGVISAESLNLLGGEVGGELVADPFGERLEADGVGRTDIQCLVVVGIDIEKLGVGLAEPSHNETHRVPVCHHDRNAETTNPSVNGIPSIWYTVTNAAMTPSASATGSSA